MSSNHSNTGKAPAQMPAPHTCSYCEDIEMCLPDQSALYRARGFMGSQGAHLGTTVDGSRVVEGAKLSCKLFAWALDGFRTKCTDEHVEDWKLTVGIPYNCFDHDSPDFTHVLFTWGRWNSEGRVERYEMLDMLSVLAEEGDEASTIVPRRPGVRDPWALSPSFLQDLISECQRDHPECNGSSHSRMPTYLLNIPDDTASEAAIQLVHTTSRVEYAALSYCWGGDQTVKLTTETLTQFTQGGIPDSQLPKTILDAITVTRKLGLRYLWIDALCIVQNDPVQTRREIDLMPSIYQGAYVTIFAARSSTVNQGFISDLSTPGTHSHSFFIRICGPDLPSRPNAPVCPTGLRGRVLCFVDSNGSNITNPIDKRGWTFQEYLLSPRLLEFGAYQTSYKCLTLEVRDGNYAELCDGRGSELLGELRANLQSEKNEGRLGLWEAAVCIYTTRLLTNGMDRPLAISGIAAVLGRQPNLAGAYLAGLWKGQLPWQLLWEIGKDARARPTGEDALGARPTAYRAPSWSWAAVDGIVSFLDHMPQGLPERILEILDTAIILEDPVVPYGAVSKGSSITVRGRIVPKIVVEGGKSLVDLGYAKAAPTDLQDEPAFQPKSKPWRPWGNYGPMPLIYPDAIGELTDGTTVHCLEVYPFHEETNNGPYGLILATNVETGVGFRRIGSFRFRPTVPRARLCMPGEEYEYETKAYKEMQEAWMIGAELADITIF